MDDEPLGFIERGGLLDKHSQTFSVPSLQIQPSLTKCFFVKPSMTSCKTHAKTKGSVAESVIADLHAKNGKIRKVLDFSLFWPPNASPPITLRFLSARNITFHGVFSNFMKTLPGLSDSMPC